ncbi:ABC transporter ATP-binding protein/permease [Deinococcus sp. KNUC1210]|uniref:ABC transporter ATP-binding protein n=1 Tax=Deinococcus sp. KNUC1210 TaxID=2917691 RepID=UPI001EEF9E84|nr:ABC transporter ATP-binding protein [Deinococcus sp. KNUC1210]ULH16744.1 ABC transporter ATP-binding protein/permease [Deinococcus sp. KNUC1210]
MNNFKTLTPYLLLHRKQYLLGSLAVLAAAIAVLLPAYFLGQAIDGLRLVAAGGSGLPGITTAPGMTLSHLILLAVGMVLATLVSGALMVAVRRNIVFASRQTEYEIRRDLFSHLSGLDKHYFDRARTGDLMNRLTGDLSAVREMIGFGSWQVVQVLCTFTVSFFWFFSINWRLTLAVLVVFPFIIGILAYLARQVSKRYVPMQEQNSAISAKAQENFSGARVVKGYAIEDREIAEYKRMNNELIRRALSLNRVEGPLQAFMSLLMGVAYVLVLIYGGRMILGLVPGSPLTLGQFTQFALTLERLAWPMLSIGMIANMLQRGLASWGRLQEIFAAQPKIRDDAHTDTSIRTLTGDIRYEHAGLTFEGRRVLQDITLHVPAGQTLGITGPTGSGKTVLAQLITRLADVTEGAVKVDGVDVRRIPLITLRENIAVVPQEPFLFSDTISNNVSFGLNNEAYPKVETRKFVNDTTPPSREDIPPDMNVVRRAAEIAGLASEVDAFPQGYDTMLGERGVTLSGGQRQRTALARAIARDPRILILDDSMSAVDTETESRILQGLRQVQQGRTVLLIGHRVSTLRNADHIIVLDGGRIIEQGSHDELLAAGGHYADLERRQRLESDLDDVDEAGIAEAAPARDVAVKETMPVKEEVKR